MRRTRGAAGSIAGLLVLLGAVSGCTTSQPVPDPPPPSWAADTPRQTVIDLADHLKDLVIATYPDLAIIPEEQVVDAQSWDCSGSPAATGERIQWSSGWQLRVEPKQDTAELLDPLVDQLVAQGWVLGHDPTTPEYSRHLDRDGYYLSISADYDPDSRFPARISFAADSPCLDNPDK